MYLVRFALKPVACFRRGVRALPAEALHTPSDIFASGFPLVGLPWPRNEADEVHMFGYGRA
jgi:divalent metal cation (Fe/Co/Zn/Cd) transporter